MPSLVEQNSSVLSLYAEAMSIASDGVIITDRDSVILDVNPAFCEITGYEKKQLIGNKPKMLSSGYHNQEFFKQLWRDIRHHGEWEGEIWDRKKSGEIFPQLLKIKAIKNAQGETTNFVGLMKDISELCTMKKMAYEDALTGLPNRRAFEQHINKELSHAKRHNKKLALLYLDLDKFKFINDNCGHRTGDKLLVKVANRLKKTIRDEDTVARVGGDEFMVIIPQVYSHDDIRLIAQKLISKISSPMTIDGHTINVGCSIGYSVYPEHSEKLSKLISKADKAMYQAKQVGTNRTFGYIKPTPA